MIPPEFYQRKNTVTIARQLLGKVLVTTIGGYLTAGRIVETEAYSHRERGCHAFGNRMTPRNKVMFEVGGHAYVYRCYGIHHLFNVVTNSSGTGDAVLIRALQPIEGIDRMMERAGVDLPKRITSGPGKLSKAMGITQELNGAWLQGGKVWLEEGSPIGRSALAASARVGIDYAGEDARLPWRFTVRNNTWVSKP